MEVCCLVLDVAIATRVIQKDLKGTEFANYSRIYEEEQDLYLWRGDDCAPDPDWVFIAAAREDIPRLVEAVRSL